VIASRTFAGGPVRRYVTVGLLAGAMAAALFPIVGIGVLSSFILADLGLSRTQLGLAVTAASTTSALAAIALGRFTDRQGGRNALVTVLLLGALAMAGIAIAPAYLGLLLAAGIAGLAMGTANPATNRLIVEAIPKRQWGTITGIKQAGEAATIVICGLLFPAIALAIGWRWAFLLTALVPAAAIGVVLAAIPRAPAPRSTAKTGGGLPLDRNLFWLAGYSLIVGLAGGSVATYLPLYAHEALGMSPSVAGLVVAAMGVVAVVGRIAWGHLARSSRDLRSRLRSIALLAVGAIVLIWLASVVNPAFVWLGAIAWGVSLQSVGAIGNLAVMAYSALENTGRASGVMLTGFGIGLMVGPPVFGWTVDTTGAYDTGFALLFAELVALTLLAFAWGRRSHPAVSPAASGEPPRRALTADPADAGRAHRTRRQTRSHEEAD
jgi:predicted MFS family arabinose efflux permease